MWNVGATVAGACIAILLWVHARPVLLGLSPTYILFPRHETLEQRLFVYAIFGVGAAVAALLATRGRVLVAAVAGTLTYFVVVATIQGLLVNPDYWKLTERGYAWRGAEVLLLSLSLGALATALVRWMAALRRGFSR